MRLTLALSLEAVSSTEDQIEYIGNDSPYFFDGEKGDGRYEEYEPSMAELDEFDSSNEVFTPF